MDLRRRRFAGSARPHCEDGGSPPGNTPVASNIPDRRETEFVRSEIMKFKLRIGRYTPRKGVVPGIKSRAACPRCRRERSRWRGGRCASVSPGYFWLTLFRDSFGSQGGPCDPSSQSNAGGTPAT
jgi:hypothetical protein